MVRPANFDVGGLEAALGGWTAIVAAQIVGELPWKQPVDVATTGNVAIATALEAGDTIDGQTLVAGWRVLVWQNTDASENGIYDVPASGAAVRVADFDDSGEIVGSFVTVRAGTVYGGKLFRNTNDAVIVVDTDDITFELWPPNTAAAEAAMVPYFIAAGDTFTVPEFKQAPFAITIDNEGTLVVDGILVEVD
jgi:hypothetical protein